MTVEGLPPHLSGEELAEKQVFYHNWLYSVVPVSRRQEDYVQTYGELVSGNSSTTQVSYPLDAFLTGYCRTCGVAFSRKIGTDTFEGHYSETVMNVPKEGCTGGY